MKFSIYFLFLSGLILMMSCASTQDDTVMLNKKEIKQYLTLEDHLLRAPGVSIVHGSVRIRGGDNSFVSSTDPLFEINGQIVSGGYQSAASLVSANEISRIEVLKNPDELGMYGVRGLNGVIKIKLRNTAGEDL